MVINGAKYAMPLIVLNLGGEMIYILNQRLQGNYSSTLSNHLILHHFMSNIAQNISADKAKKVLQDVVRAMFASGFINDLFQPRKLPDILSVKQIFEKFAHSSIMRLNKSSMDKLFDLMMMGLKYQVLQCASPQQYLHLLLNHLDTIAQLVDGVGSIDLLSETIDLSSTTFSALSIPQWIQLKHCLYKFIKGKKIKVSLFLQNRMQSLDGVLNLDLRGKLPYKTGIPGYILYYENGLQVFSSGIINKYNDINICENNQYIDPDSTIGMNMYAKNFQADVKVRDSLDLTLNALRLRELSSKTGTKAEFKSLDKKTSLAGSIMAKSELNMLSGMLGMNHDADDKAVMNKTFHINLFPESTFDMKGDSSDPETSTDNYDSNFIILDIDATADSKSMVDYFKSFDLDDSKPLNSAENKSNDFDDLLALMDSAK